MGTSTPPIPSTHPGSGAVSAGEFYGCAVKTSGAVACWGDGSAGALGKDPSSIPVLCNDLVGDESRCEPVPVTVGHLTGAASVSAGGNTTCAVLASGRVACWGSNSSGQLGIGATHGPQRCKSIDCSWQPVTVTGISDAVQVSSGLSGSAGGSTVCALRRSGQVACWGDDTAGTVGTGSLASKDCRVAGVAARCSPAPSAVAGIHTAIDVSVGVGFACAVLFNGHVECWGANSNGTLGDGTAKGSVCLTAPGGVRLVCRPHPTDVTGLDNAIQVAAGGGAACALLKSGHVECWGANVGMLGTGSDSGPQSCRAVLGYALPCSSSPVEVTGLADATSVSVGAGAACAVRTDHRIACWGDNTTGELGVGTTTGPMHCHTGNRYAGPSACSTRPVTVGGIGNAVAVTVGWDTACAEQDTGTVVCWGSNAFGQTGQDNTGGTDKCELNAYVSDKVPMCDATPGRPVWGTYRTP